MSEIELTAQSPDAASRAFAVRVPVDRVEAAEAAATARYAKQARIPGFRKGHVPSQVVRQRFRDAIRQAALEDLVRQAWERARSDGTLRPIGQPQVRNVTFEPGSPLTFDLVVQVRPEIKLARLGGFRLKRRLGAVTHEMAEAQLLALREQRAPWVPVEGPPQPGDLVEVAVTELDGEGPSGPAAPGAGGGAGARGAPESVHFVLGRGEAPPELEARVAALAPGGSWEGVLPRAGQSGEPAADAGRRIRLRLLELKRQSPPELSDEWAREVGDFDTLEQLRGAVRADLELEARREAEARLRGDLVAQLAEANAVAVPASLMERALASYAEAHGVGAEQRARFAAEVGPVVEAAVRRDLIIEAVAEQAQLAVTEAELDARVAELAARRGTSPGALHASLEKAGRLRELARAMTEEKVFAHLLGLQTVEEAPAAG